MPAEKMEKLKKIVGKFKRVIVAFSGGVDSTFLARVCGDILGPSGVLLVTAESPTYPASELEGAKALAVEMGLAHRVIASDELNIPGFKDNPPDRCYYCKRELFGSMIELAKKEGYEAVFDGSNADDLADYRPGRRALTDLGVHSPLCKAGMTKEDIRENSRKLGLTTADKPAYACLASRFPYGETITRDKLARVEKAERDIRALGFTQFRVRSHGDLARLEFIPAEMDRAWSEREKIDAACRKSGFIYTAIDSRGFRSGAMNEALPGATGKKAAV